MIRLFSLLAALVLSSWSIPAFAEVTMSFHSFNGSVLFGRYPHTFVVLEGTVDRTGEVVDENYGFTAKNISTRILSGPVEHEIMIEKDKYIRKTNRHFTVTITEQQLAEVRDTVRAWRDAPGKYYSLDERNCIHFVGALAQIVGVKVDYPDNMTRRPKKWLNHITAQNPQLGAKRIK
ncbi:MAG: hypothetical protein WA908_01270 [Pontixanthobacter sp.]